MDILELLLSHNADPKIYNKNALSPLHICVEFGAPDAARQLLMKGADPNYQDSNGQTPFHMAVIKRDLTLSQIFYESGADPEVRDAKLQTVWMYCDEQFQDQVTQAPPKEGPPPPEPETPPPEDPRQWLIDGKCFICRNPADHLVLPCRHKVICQECAKSFFEQYNTCPDCYMAVFAAIKE